jgi:hypothetical protein
MSRATGMIANAAAKNMSGAEAWLFSNTMAMGMKTNSQ